MKLGVSYNVFDAEELLEPSILAIRDVVDHISLVYQEVSNSNNPCSDRLVAIVHDLKKRGLVNKIYKFTPDLNKNSSLNEMAKRNIGLRIAKLNLCTHFLSMDADEFYDRDNFAKAKKIIQDNKMKGSAVRVQNHFKTPENAMIYKDIKYFVSFIYKIQWGKKFEFRAEFPVEVDPTRRIKTENQCYIFEPAELVMDHMTLVRKNIRAKLENSSANELYHKNNIDEYVRYFENWEPSQPAYPPSNYNNIVKIKAVPDKYNIKKFL